MTRLAAWVGARLRAGGRDASRPYTDRGQAIACSPAQDAELRARGGGSSGAHGAASAGGRFIAPTGRHPRPITWHTAVAALALSLAACAPAAVPAPATGQTAPAAASGPAAPAAAGQAPPAPISFVLGLSSISPTNANIQATKDAGLFLKYGLDPELQYIGGGTNSMAALASGDVPILVGGVPAFVSAALEGGNVVVIAVQGNRFDYYFVTTPDIQRPDDLRGKSLSGTRKGALADTAIRLVLRVWGIDPDRDVNVLPAGAGNDARTLALLNGATVGTVLNVPLPPAIAQGNFHVLADLTQMDLAYANNGVAARRADLAQRPDFYERFMRAYVEGIHYFKTHPAEGARAIMEWGKVDDPEYARAAYDFYAGQFPRVPVPTPGAMQAVLDSLAEEQPSAKNASVDSVVDLRFVQQLEASGFIARLYGGAP